MKPECRQRIRYIACDYVLLNIGWLAFNVVRFHSLPHTWSGTFAEFFNTSPVLLGQLLVPLMALALYALSGYYNLPFDKSRVDDLLNTAGTSAVTAVAVFFAVLINDDIPERLLNYQLLVILWALLALPVYLGRATVTARAKRMIKDGRLRFPTLVLGSGDKAMRLAERLRRIPTAMGFAIEEYVDTADTHAIDRAVLAAAEGRIQNVILADDRDDNTHTAALLGRFIPTGCSVFMVPDLYNLLTVRPRVSSVANEPLVNITSGGMSALTSNMKRLGDIAVSAFALVALAPVFATIAIAVKADSNGPVFYSQERVGLHKRRFRIHKFRTMRPDAEAAGPQLSRESDPRITRTGAVLRKYRLDELPQFWDVLRGRMSLVGPRPERAFYLEQMERRAPYVSLIHRVRPGITSWGMVRYGYAGSIDEMLERLPYDLLYIENVSLSVDLRIMLHTIDTVVTGKGL